MVYYFLFITTLKNILSLKTLKDILQHFKFVKLWIREFVVSFFDVTYRLYVVEQINNPIFKNSLKLTGTREYELSQTNGFSGSSSSCIFSFNFGCMNSTLAVDNWLGSTLRSSTDLRPRSITVTCCCNGYWKTISCC